MRRATLTAAFRRDLDEAFLYIAEDNFSAARRFRAAVRAALRDVTHMPTMAPSRPDLPPAYRAMRVQTYSIIYRFDDGTVYFLRLLHGARDFTQQF